MIIFQNSKLETFLRYVSYAGKADPLSRENIGDRVYIEKTTEGFSMSCTDGHRVAWIEFSGGGYTTGQKVEGSVYSLDLLSHVMKRIGPKQSVALLPNGEISTESFSIQVKQKREFSEFPDLSPVLPSSSEIQIIASRKELQKAVKYALEKAKKISPKSNAHTIIFEIQKSEGLSPRIAIYPCEDSEDRIALEHATIEGNIQQTKIGFNGAYVEESIRRSLKGDLVHIDLLGNLSPAVFRGAETLGEDQTLNATCVIMPMRI